MMTMQHSSDCNTQVSGIRGEICNCHPREQVEHTPTPWSAASNWIMRRHPTCDVQVAVCAAYTAPKAISDPRDRANAAFIVKAVNSFDKRDMALRQAQTIITDYINGVERTAWQEVLTAINAALIE